MTEANERYFPEIAVAAVDILGLKSLVRQEDKCMLAIKTMTAFVDNACRKETYGDPTASQKAGNSYEEDVYFGDSVYLFADATKQVSEQVGWLAAKVATLIYWGLNHPRCFLVRAGIAVGDLRKRTIKTEGRSHDIRIGTSMVRAHLLERAQSWIGGAIDTCAPIDKVADWVVQYPVPLKSGSFEMGKPIALNWIGQDMEQQQVEKALHQTVNEIGSGDDAKNKLDNTVRFVKFVFAAQKFAPFSKSQADNQDKRSIPSASPGSMIADG